MTRSAADLIAEAKKRSQDPGGSDTAIALLEQAIALEPSRGDAYLSLASV